MAQGQAARSPSFDGLLAMTEGWMLLAMTEGWMLLAMTEGWMLLAMTEGRIVGVIAFVLMVSSPLLMNRVSLSCRRGR